MDQVINSLFHKLNQNKYDKNIMVPNQSKGGELYYVKCMVLQGTLIGILLTIYTKMNNSTMQPINQLPNNLNY